MNRFSDIVGMETIKEHLQGAIAGGKMGHAYIINGGLGSGKKMLARALAKSLQCENLEETIKESSGDISKIDACCNCHSCLQTDTDNEPDIIWVKRSKSVISVDDIRDQLVNDIQIKPYSSRYKIYIIDEAEKLGVPAQNALLKTIEEPPAYGIIILLTTNADIFLQTILSRCVLLDIKPIDKKTVVNYLKSNQDMIKERYEEERRSYGQNIDQACLVNSPDLSEANLEFAADFAQGRIGRAVDMLASIEFDKLKESVISLVKNAKDMTCAEICTRVKEIAEYKPKKADDGKDKGAEDKNAASSVRKFYIDDFLDLLAVWFRDVLVFKSCSDLNFLTFKNEISSVKDMAETVSYEGIQDILDSIDRVKIRLKANVNFDLCIELLIMAIKENM